jgi:D123 protein
MLLKSSDFIVHDLSTESVFEGCANNNNNDDREYKLELVLRKWFAIDPSREMRAFVREGVLIGTVAVFSSYERCVNLTHSFPSVKSKGISQRGDANYYEFLNEPETQRKIVSSFVAYWTAHVKPKWTGPASCK